MKKYIILFLIMISVLLFSACSNAASQEYNYVNLPDIEDYPILNIQIVDENGAVTDSSSKAVKDNDKIKELIDSLEQIEVTTPSKEEMEEEFELMKTEGYYMFILSDENSDKIYAYNFSKDGNIHLQSETENRMIYSSKEKKPKLLEEFKDTLGMNF